MSTENKILLKVEGLTKRFPGVLALDNVSLQAHAGEVVGICGENGAGKSTLIKMLTGAYTPDSGSITFDGKTYKSLDPRTAMAAGIACIYQELNLIPHMTVMENIFLGREYFIGGKSDILDRARMNAKAKELLADLDLSIKPSTRLGNLGVGHQQMIEICRAMLSNARLIIMDEPTSSLSEKEAEDLFRVIAQMKERGVAILFISHRLDEVRMNCDSVTVMRDGATVSSFAMKDSSVAKIIQHMVGREIQNKYPKEVAEHKNVVLSVKHLESKGLLHDVSFDLKAGEVLGFAGLVGAGRTETMRAITGADGFDSGTIEVNGKPVKIREPLDSINAGIAFLTENRKEQGLILIQSVAFNATMVKMEKYSSSGWLNVNKLKKAAKRVCDDMRLKTAGMETHVGKLSGGNQQKVVIAKWLLSNAKIFIFDEPTRGIDVGAKVEVYKLINELVANGAGVIIICSEMEEVMGMADRILVMHEGAITGELSREEATQEKIMYAASGFSQAS
ncbi:sugar ABC transporter ATP-binding protein [uncultured Cohaesibacter sp.]|uniref:sugar ABC transporter ATP-binding protein n=1 Tax=uncultured Cohaesibacter sp. TaxID=1002546 RepID=UPI0029C87A56|nr:sugar ABC transporter ATP-binding protein [uncultured Cohaesibacter sp.]